MSSMILMNGLSATRHENRSTDPLFERSQLGRSERIRLPYDGNDIDTR